MLFFYKKNSKKFLIFAFLSLSSIIAINCILFFHHKNLNANSENKKYEDTVSNETLVEKINDEKNKINYETSLDKENTSLASASKELNEQPNYNNSKLSKNEEKKSEKINRLQNTNIDYTKLYPDLYCVRPETQITPNKTIFLTFDDGPSDRTSEILKILNESDIKATFFVTGNASAKGKALMKQIVDEGHTIAIHTYTHEFKKIYSSVEAFLDDFNKIYNLIYENTGIKPTIFRFPGGSKNNFNKNNYKEIIAEMKRRGFDYFDWNLSVGDAVSRKLTPTQKCINNVLNFSKNCNHGVVLMHDAKPKTTTVEALPHIINGLKEQGFTFDKLSNKIDPAPYSLVKPYR